MIASITIERWRYGKVESQRTVSSSLLAERLSDLLSNIGEIPHVNPDERIVLILEPTHDTVPGPMR